MDITIKIEDMTLNIRVAAILKTSKGYLFEKSKNGYLFPVGGRVKLWESSEEAIKREIKEEIGMEISKMKLVSLIENFFLVGEEKIQELCFVYEAEEEFAGAASSEFIEIRLEDIDKNDIRPSSIIEILKSEKGSFKHFIIK